MKQLVKVVNSGKSVFNIYTGPAKDILLTPFSHTPNRPGFFDFTGFFYDKVGIEYRKDCIRYIEKDSILGCECSDKDECPMKVVADYINNLYAENKIIYVFGSNLAGRHGKGTALTAKEKYGAKYGCGEGPQGYSYAIPTKDENLCTLSLPKIKRYVHKFIEYATERPHLIFRVVKVGCGLAGHKEEDIAPMFANAPINCILPEGWNNYSN